MLLRIFFAILLLISVLFWPLYISIILGLIGMFYFPTFIEAVFIFLISDLLQGGITAHFYGIPFISFLGALMVYGSIELLKKKLKFYSLS